MFARSRGWSRSRPSGRPRYARLAVLSALSARCCWLIGNLPQVRSDVRECLGKGGELNTRFSPANNVVSGPLLAQQLASSLRSRGYHAHAHGGGAATSAEMSLSNCHTFVSIDPLSCSDEPTVVEPQFKQMFLCGRSTSWYNQLLCEVPEVFVCSSASRMRTLVRFLAERMAETLHCAGLDVPPWRRPGNMLSMWNLKTPPPVSERKAPAAVLQLTQQHQCGTGIAAPTLAAKLKPVKPR